MKKKSFLKFLGRGSMFNPQEGNTSAYWKDDTGETMILIDCGCTVFSKIMEKNLLDGVKELVVLITHTHTDHVGSLSDLIYYITFCTDIKMSIGTSAPNISPLSSYLDSVGNAKLMKNCDRITLLGCSSISKMRVRDTVFTHCEISFIDDPSHKVPHVNGDTNNSGLLMQFQDKTIYYSGDTQRIPYESLDMSYIDELYVDSAVRTSSDGKSKYPHYLLYDLYVDLQNTGFPIEDTWLMHIDCPGVFDEANQFGFNIVEVE